MPGHIPSTPSPLPLKPTPLPTLLTSCMQLVPSAHLNPAPSPSADVKNGSINITRCQNWSINIIRHMPHLTLFPHHITSPIFHIIRGSYKQATFVSKYAGASKADLWVSSNSLVAIQFQTKLCQNRSFVQNSVHFLLKVFCNLLLICRQRTSCLPLESILSCHVFVQPSPPT